MLVTLRAQSLTVAASCHFYFHECSLLAKCSQVCSSISTLLHYESRNLLKV